jgi:hypothetical protein
MDRKFLSRYGIFARSLPFTTGQMFFVKSTSDTDYGDVSYELPPFDGITRLYSTLALAAAATVAGRGDIVVCPDSLVTQAGITAMASDAMLVTPGTDTSVGTRLIVKKTITSSTITTSAQDLTSTALGEFLIDNVILKTDSTGLAGATNFRILSNNSKGLVAICEEAVANLGANKTVDIFTASVVKQRTVLESGKKLQFLGTASAGTGAGTIDVYVELVRRSPGGYIVAV